MSFGKKYISEETNELGRGTKVGGRRYNNPYFDNKPKRDYRKLLKYWLILAILCVILAIFLTIPFFAIKTVNIQNEGRISNDKILELINSQKNRRVLSVFLQENVFLFNSDDLIHKLKVNYNFKDVKIEKRFPNKLSVAVVQREPAYIISENGSNYLIDKEGFVITKEVNQADQALFVKIGNPASDRQDIMKFDSAELHLDKIAELLAEVKTGLLLIVSEARIGSDPDTIELRLKDGPKVYFSSSRQIPVQIKKLSAIKDELKENFSKKEYIDLRIDENIYIK